MRSKTSARNDPQTILASLYERGEEALNVFLDELLRNRRLRNELGKTVGRAADAKKRVDRNIQTLLSLLNLPSRGDYDRLLTKIEALQGSMVNLNIKLDRMLAGQHQESRRQEPYASRPPTGRPSKGGRATARKRTRGTQALLSKV